MRFSGIADEGQSERAHWIGENVLDWSGLAKRFDAAVADGELSGVDTVVLARWIVAVGQGISVQARSGASRAELFAVADLAMAGWPGTGA